MFEFTDFVDYISGLWASFTPLILLVFGLAVAFYLGQRIIKIAKSSFK